MRALLRALRANDAATRADLRARLATIARNGLDAPDDARFRRPVTPGDQMRILVEQQRSRGNVFKFKGRATVDDALCAEATFSAMIVEQ